SNDFMKAVEEDREWQLVFPDTSDPDYDKLWDGNLKRWRDEYKKPVKVYRTIRAREMWDTIIESAWLSAEPGVVFLERMNEYNNRSEEHTSELQSRENLVCRLLLEKKNITV